MNRKLSVPQVVQSSVADGIAWLHIDRPEAHNALNEAVVAQLGQAVQQALDDPQVRGLAIAARGKAFVAGVDLKFFVRGLLAGDLDRLVHFTHAAQELLNTLAGSPKPVVARVHGIALGGGVELALACGRIVAGQGARLGFPETGLGIYPGLGGTQRTPRRIGAGLAKWLLYTGHTLAADEALGIGLVDCVVPDDASTARVREMIIGGLPPRVRPPLSAEHRALAALFVAQPVEALLAGAVDTRGVASLDRTMRRMTGKAPLALKFVEQLIDRGASLPLPAALQLELDYLREIFSTEDARTGLGTLGKKRPVFLGR